MLTTEQDKILRATINDSLNRAERHWINGGHKLAASREAVLESMQKIVMDSEPSKIPGHKLVQDDETVIDEFIAFVADMRDSSRHLMCAISEKTAKVSGLQRVFYETSALLPSLALAIKFEDGNVTEYLGDGVLALFRVDPNNRKHSIYAANRAAKNSIIEVRSVVNEILSDRYWLPNIDIGVGLSLSKTLVTLVGLPTEKHPKAFGECVFRATKLSGGRNEIITDQYLKSAWPSGKGGTITFKSKKMNNVDGYLISSTA